jgi:hypothetical protein
VASILSVRSRRRGGYNPLPVTVAPLFILPLFLTGTAPQATAHWQLVVATEGGFGGRGKGGVEVRSTGELWVAPWIGPKCEYRLSELDLARIDSAVKLARPKQWQPRYVRADNPTGCCDQYTTLLFLTLGKGGGERLFGTGWFDDSRRLAPMDAQRLQSAAAALTKTYPCKPRR